MLRNAPVQHPMAHCAKAQRAGGMVATKASSDA